MQHCFTKLPDYVCARAQTSWKYPHKRRLQYKVYINSSMSIIDNRRKYTMQMRPRLTPPPPQTLVNIKKRIWTIHKNDPKPNKKV